MAATYNPIYSSLDGILNDKYSIDNGTGYYNLIIKSTDSSVASKYVCELPLVNTGTAQLYASLVAVGE